MVDIRKSNLNINVEANYGRDASQMRSIVKSSINQSVVNVGDSRELLFNLRDTKIKDGVSDFFARNGFELADYTPNLPVHQFFWQGLVPVRYGGGYAEQVAAFRLNFQLPEGRATGTQSNNRVLSGVKQSKITVPAYPLQFAVGVTEFELMKNDHVNFDVLGFRLEALRLGYQRELEINAFMGNVGINGITEGSKDFYPGLLNMITDKDTNATELSAIEIDLPKNWLEMTLDDWVATLVKGANRVKRNLAFRREYYPNTLAVAPEVWENWLQPAVINGAAQTKVGIAMNIIDYLEDALTRAYEQRVIIREVPYLDRDEINVDTTANIKAGGEFGKLALYRNDERAMRFHITMPLTGGSYYQTNDGWFQNFITIYTPLLVIYPTMTYFKNVAPTPPVEEGEGLEGEGLEGEGLDGL